jgi:hypothetical protein
MVVPANCLCHGFTKPVVSFPTLEICQRSSAAVVMGLMLALQTGNPRFQ